MYSFISKFFLMCGASLFLQSFLLPESMQTVNATKANVVKKVAKKPITISVHKEYKSKGGCNFFLVKVNELLSVLLQPSNPKKSSNLGNCLLKSCNMSSIFGIKSDKDYMKMNENILNTKALKPFIDLVASFPFKEFSVSADFNGKYHVADVMYDGSRSKFIIKVEMVDNLIHYFSFMKDGVELFDAKLKKDVISELNMKLNTRLALI